MKVRTECADWKNRRSGDLRGRQLCDGFCRPRGRNKWSWLKGKRANCPVSFCAAGGERRGKCFARRFLRTRCSEIFGVHGFFFRKAWKLSRAKCDALRRALGTQRLN